MATLKRSERMAWLAGAIALALAVAIVCTAGMPRTHAAEAGPLPPIFQAGIHVYAYTESLGNMRYLVREVRGEWVLFELVLPPNAPEIQALLANVPLRWVNVANERGFWSVVPGPQQ